MAGFWEKWKQPDDAEDPYVRFTTPGTKVKGIITKLGSTDFGGRESAPVPVVYLKTKGGEKILNASQKVLLSKLSELCPEIGDGLEVTYTGDAPNALPGRNPAKLFDVRVVPQALLGSEKAEPEPVPVEEPPEAFEAF